MRNLATRPTLMPCWVMRVWMFRGLMMIWCIYHWRLDVAWVDDARADVAWAVGDARKDLAWADVAWVDVA